jgi:hypothetical protein
MGFLPGRWPGGAVVLTGIESIKLTDDIVYGYFLEKSLTGAGPTTIVGAR